MNRFAAYINDNIVISGGDRVYVPPGINYAEAENIILSHQSKGVRDHYILTAQEQYLDTSLGTHINPTSNWIDKELIQSHLTFGDIVRSKIVHCGGVPYRLAKSEEISLDNGVLERKLLGGQSKQVVNCYFKKYGTLV
jgi:hypothetical protein